MRAAANDCAATGDRIAAAGDRIAATGDSITATGDRQETCSSAEKECLELGIVAPIIVEVGRYRDHRRKTVSDAVESCKKTKFKTPCAGGGHKLFYVLCFMF